MISRYALVFLLLVSGACVASGQPASIPLQSMTVLGIYASKPGDTTVYCLLGGGACLLPRDAGTADTFIAKWVASHPNATAIPVSSVTQTMPNNSAKHREVFILVEDGGDLLNVALVHEGYYSSKSMIDMVQAEELSIERERKLAAENHNDTFRDLMEKRRATTPQEDRPHRFIADSDYALRMKQISSAEQDAQLAKKGIWSGDASQGISGSTLSAKSRQSFGTRDLYVHGVHAHRLGDPDIYCLLGGDFCLFSLMQPISDEKEVAFVSDWLSRYPSATATPISAESRKTMRALPPAHTTYIWIQDGKESLNLALVRNGYYRAEVLADMVETRQRFDDSMKTPAMSGAKAQIEKAQSEEDAPQRLVTNQNYKSKMEQAHDAEKDATREKVGIWAAAEIARWNPPSDAAMIEAYFKHQDWFRSVSALVRSDSRLANIMRSPVSIAKARSEGITQANIDAYVGLLEKLGVNETLASVYGIGEVSLIKADIVVGPFDNGVIKGYVFSPSNPRLIVKDLEKNWPPDLANTNTAFRSIGNNWYLFEVRH